MVHAQRVRYFRYIRRSTWAVAGMIAAWWPVRVQKATLGLASFIAVLLTVFVRIEKKSQARSTVKSEGLLLVCGLDSSGSGARAPCVCVCVCVTAGSGR